MEAPEDAQHGTGQVVIVVHIGRPLADREFTEQIKRAIRTRGGGLGGQLGRG